MRRSRGFTVLELVVALALAGSVLLMARRILSAVLDGSTRLTAERARLDAESNGRRLLRSVFGSIDLASDGAAAFEGRNAWVEFSAWSAQPTGRQSLQRIRVAAEAGGLHVTSATMRLKTLNAVGALELDYLLVTGANEHWVREWVSPVRPPVAIRLRIERPARVDTLLFVVGPRG